MDFLEENDIKKGIVTNKEHELAVNTAKNLLGKWKFEDIIGSDDKKHPRKPDSYGVDKISKETNIPKNRILYVGDMEVDCAVCGGYAKRDFKANGLKFELVAKAF